MILIIHIAIALASIAYTTELFFRPAEGKFKPAYLLAASTLVSGTILVVDRNSHLVESCVTGLIYLSCVTFAIAISRRKLAFARQK